MFVTAVTSGRLRVCLQVPGGDAGTGGDQHRDPPDEGPREADVDGKGKNPANAALLVLLNVSLDPEKGRLFSVVLRLSYWASQYINYGNPNI